MVSMLDEPIRIEPWIMRLSHYMSYEVCMKRSGQMICLGTYSTLEDAQEAAREVFPEQKIHYHIEPRRIV